MKKTLYTLMLGLSVAISALAGEADCKSACVVAPVEQSSFVAVSVGYADELDSEIYTLQLGHSWGQHSIFGEMGYTSNKSLGFDAEYIPVTVNYQFDAPLFSGLDYYAGAGAGVAVNTLDFEGDEVYSSTDFMVQAFAGLSYSFTENVSLYGGVKYQWVDVEGGEDQVSYDLGLKYRF